MDPRYVRNVGALRRLSRGLIAYGIVGLLVSGIGLGETVWVNGRIDNLRHEAATTAARLTTTMELAAVVLRGASTTAGSFGGTADQTAEALSSAAGTATEVRSDLAALEAQLRSVTFFGAAPLSSSADAVGRIATRMAGLDAQLALVTESLRGNGTALAGNATTLAELADSTDALAARLGPGVGQDSFGDVQLVIAATLLMFAAWSFVPAVGSLALGLWLAREPAAAP
jgi:hypothetical protein